MSWKTTAVLAALLGVSLIVYFAWNPVPPIVTEEERKLLDITAQDLVRIEIARKGESPVTIERGKDAVGDFWRLAPSGHPADPGAVQKMVFGLERYSRTTGIDSSKPEVAPSITGLEAPRFVVTFHAADRRRTLKFGASPPTNTEVVFFQLEGDPKVYTVEKETAEAFDRPAVQLRSKQLARFVPHAAVEVETAFRFVVSRQGQPKTIEYEKSTFERVEEGVERGWFLTRPQREKLDDLVVNRLVTDLAGLAVDSFEPPGNPVIQGLEHPEFIVSIRLFKSPNPVVVHFGGLADGGKKRWVRIPGSGEVGLIPSARYDALPRQRGDFRSKVLYQFSKEMVRTLEVEADGLGRLLIERRETRREGDPVAAVSWEVLEPKGARIRREKVEPYVRDVLAARIEEFVGATDFAQIKQDSPLVSMTVETSDLKKQRVLFKAAGNNAWGRKEGVDEVFTVMPSYVKLLQLLDLALLQEEVFNAPRQDLRKIEFDGKFSGNLQPIHYALELDERTGKWAFVDPAFKGTEADPQRVAGFLTMLSFISADGGRFVGRDAETLRKFRLDDLKAPARLTIWHKGGPREGVTILISDNQNPQPALFTYFARRADGPAVFRIVSQLVEALKKPPVKAE